MVAQKANQMISSQAQRDVASKDEDDSSGLQSPIDSTGKTDRGRPQIKGLESIAEQIERPKIRIEDLGATSPDHQEQEKSDFIDAQQKHS